MRKLFAIVLLAATTWALVRQYYTDGFYPSGVATPSDRFSPSAALLKATLIASARRMPYIMTTSGQLDTKPVPSYEQGFGFPVLADALYFPGNVSKLRVADVLLDSGLAQGQTATYRFSVRPGTPLRVVLVWSDPPGVPLVNDLDLRVTDPAGDEIYGNESLHPGQRDRVNNVEAVSTAQPLAGTYTISVSANRLGVGQRQSYALVVTGDLIDSTSRSRAVRHL